LAHDDTARGRGSIQVAVQGRNRDAGTPSRRIWPAGVAACRVSPL